MLKQSSSRNVRGKSLKVKHAVQIFVILAICIWFVYHVKQSHDKKELAASNSMEEKLAAKVYEVVRIGRKHLKPQLEEEKDEVEVEDVMREKEGEESGDGDEEREGSEKEKSEDLGEHDQLQDFIDEDDKDT